MNIVICDSNKVYHNQLVGLIKRKTALYNYNVVLCTETPTEVINYVNKGNNENTIYLIETQLKNCCGVSLAARIREKDRTSYVILLSDKADSKCLLAYKKNIQAFDYIITTRTDFHDRLISCLLKIYEIQNNAKENEVLTIKHKSSIDNIFQSDILFIESIPNSHKLILHYRSRNKGYLSEIFYDNLFLIEERLSSDFIRCHKSYIVNRSYIKKINKKNRIIEMENGKICLYSRDKSKLLLENLQGKEMVFNTQ